MQKPNLVKVIYQDAGRGIFLECYADTIVYRTSAGGSHTLVAIRIGGYPEQVRAMSDAIYGGGSVRLEQGEKVNMLMSSQPKQYDRSQSMDGVYAEAALFLQDEAEIAAAAEEPKQQKLPSQRNCYIFTPAGDRNRLLDEIDRRTGVPLIREFQDYFLDTLIREKTLVPLKVFSPNSRFDAWQLTCTQDDQNLIEVLEEGLKTGAVTIPGATPENSAAFEQVHTVSQYLHQFGVTIADRIKEQFRPLFDPETELLSPEVIEVNETIRRNCGYGLYPAQLAAAEALKRKTDRDEPALIVAECGSGKSKIGAAALYASHRGAGKAKTFNIILCPSHVAKKWAREVKETVPRSTAAVIGSIAELRRFHQAYQRGEQTAFAIVGKEKARDGYSRYPSAVWNRVKRRFVCPECGKPIMVDISKDGVRYTVPAEAPDFLRENQQNHKCRSCGAVLWSPLTSSTMQTEWVKVGGFGFVHRCFAGNYLLRTKDPHIKEQVEKICCDPDAFYPAVGAVRRFPISSYIKQKMKGQIDGVLCDELHQYNNDSGQGDAMGEIVRTADKVIGMTATLINGYASGIFHLLYRLLPQRMELDGQNYHASGNFSKEYGVVESTYQIIEAEYNTNRRTSKRKLRERQLPGVSPLVYSRFLLDNALFLSLADMGKHLPEYEEIPIQLEMRADVFAEYKRLEEEFRKVMSSGRNIAQKVMSAFMGLLTVYPDQPYDQPPILNPLNKKEILVTPASLSNIGELHQKELKLLELVARKMSRGENVLIYTSWVRIDTQKKLLELFARQGWRAAVLSVTVSPQKREEWVEKQLRSGVRIVITNPPLVETGLDLNAFTTIVFYNIAYNLFTLRQASRRSLRINQTAPRIEVYFFFYKDTMQARAMRLMASKLMAAGVLEGNITDEGLAAMSDCRDLTSQLARELTIGIQDEVEDLSAVFKKMAVTRPPEEKVILLPEPVSVHVPESPSLPQTTQPEPVILFAAAFQRRRKAAEPQFCENQLSFFDQPA